MGRESELPATVSTYWRTRRLWDRWHVEHSEVNTGKEHIRQRELTVAAVRAMSRQDLRILDLCCGTGKVSSDLLWLPNVEEVVALDINPRALGILHERLAAHPESRKLTTIERDIMCDRALSLLGLFDIVVCLDALHHLWSLPEALSRIAKLLTVDGVLVGNFLPFEALARHVRSKKGQMRYLSGNIRAESVRLLSCIDWIWNLAGRRGFVRFLPLNTSAVLKLVEVDFVLVQLKQSDYCWFTAVVRDSIGADRLPDRSNIGYGRGT